MKKTCGTFDSQSITTGQLFATRNHLRNYTAVRQNVRLHRDDDQNELIFINQWFLSQLFGGLNKFNASKKWQVPLFERAGLYDRSSQATCPAMTF